MYTFWLQHDNETFIIIDYLSPEELQRITD